MSGLDEKSLKKFSFVLLALSLFGAVLMPAITISDSIPKVEISDITFGLLLIITLLYFRKQVLNYIKRNMAFVWVFIVFILVASVSIVVAERYFSLRDWFEPLKYFKLLSFVFFFYIYTDVKLWKKLIQISFISLILFNILHYFNLFNFNQIIEPFYSANHHLDFFGLNSIGEPATKRMLGTAGNPNNNAIMFLVYMIVFLPRKQTIFKYSLILSVLAIICVFACQSRTGFISMFIVLIAYFVFLKSSWKVFFIILSAFVVSFTVLQLAGNSYVSSLTSVTHLESASLGRTEQWNRIIDANQNKVLLGNGVNKELMQKSEIFSESEYFLIYFRYGLIGLLSFLSVYLVLFFKKFYKYKYLGGFMVMSVVILFAVSGITNTPLHSTKLSFLFSMVVGVGMLLHKTHKFGNQHEG